MQPFPALLALASAGYAQAASPQRCCLIIEELTGQENKQFRRAVSDLALEELILKAAASGSRLSRDHVMAPDRFGAKGRLDSRDSNFHSRSRIIKPVRPSGQRIRNGQ